jgi:hypothetical protein
VRVRLTQVDGKLPNLALMKLAHWHRSRGDDVHYTKRIERDLLEPRYDAVYGSAIFNFSAERVARFRRAFPQAIVGGTYNTADNRTVEQLIGTAHYEHYDYSILPTNEKGEVFQGSIGFTQRGCRLKCGFCVVPKKEGKTQSINTIGDIWRGEPWPRHLHLLDNDFFGQPRQQWQARVDEIVAGEFKVCFNQGINTRMIDDESAAALKRMGYWDDGFTRRRLYTAWDNIGDEARFFRGVETLAKHGIPPSHLMVYMLVGYDKRETWERVLYRFRRMTDIGIRPYPMVFGERDRSLSLGGAPERLERKSLGDFQRWAIRKIYTVLPFEHYRSSEDRRLTTEGQLSMDF